MRKALTQKQQDLRSEKAWQNLQRRIDIAGKKHDITIEKAFALYDKEK